MGTDSPVSQRKPALVLLLSGLCFVAAILIVVVAGQVLPDPKGIEPGNELWDVVALVVLVLVALMLVSLVTGIIWLVVNLVRMSRERQ